MIPNEDKIMSPTGMAAFNRAQQTTHAWPADVVPWRARAARLAAEF